MENEIERKMKLIEIKMQVNNFLTYIKTKEET